MIEAYELTKSFGAVPAVRGVSFSVKSGEAVGFLGPNGAGKTTTFRVLSGIIGPSSGSVTLSGKDLGDDPIGAKRCLGYMPENAPLYPELTVSEYLTYRAELKHVAGKKKRAEVERVCALTNTQSMMGTKIAHLSKGYRQRVALSDALLGNPPILLLDEPTAGLDPNQVLDVRKLIVELARDHAILLSTHVLSEVTATCSRAIVIHEGRIVGQGTLEQLETNQGPQRADLVVTGPWDTVRGVLGTALLTTRGTSRGDDSAKNSLQIDLSEHPLDQFIARLVGAGVLVHEAMPSRARLDEVFAELTQGAKGTVTSADAKEDRKG